MFKFVARPQVWAPLVLVAIVATTAYYAKQRNNINPVSTEAAPGDVTITVNANTRHQVIEGFGASTEQRADCNFDELGSSSNRQNILDAMYKIAPTAANPKGGVGLTMGDMHVNPIEAIYPSGSCQPGQQRWNVMQRQNDNNNPAVFNWNGFLFDSADSFKTDLVDRAPGLNNYLIRGGVSTRWQDLWLQDLRWTNYNLYIQEAAENALAPTVYWKNTYGIVPKWQQLFNEPLNGNTEIWGGDAQDLVDITKEVCNRLPALGLSGLKFVIPSSVNEGSGLAEAEYILNDPGARACIGAISYHPYGSNYNEISSILNSSGQGNPPSYEVSVRNDIRNLAQQYGLQVWMTEVSGGNGGSTFDWLRGRAIHIHDEMVYANASSFWGMFNMGQMGGGGEYDDDSAGVIYGPNGSNYRITAMGQAIGHYARWVTPGSVRVEATSSDPLVQVTAFKDDATGKLSFVVINNGDTTRNITLNLTGNSFTGQLSGEQSTSSAYWQPISAITPTASSFTLSVPAYSVSSVGAPASTTPPSDTTAPTVTVTAPANNATVNGTVALTANASDNIGVVGVQFKIDGTNTGSEDTNAPYTVNVNTTTLANGNHTITAVARDAAGNSTTASAITITVNNVVPDTTSPTVSVTAPSNGSTVSGTTNVAASAGDNVGVTGVQFKIDGNNLGSEDTSSPYAVSVNTTTFSNGTHALTAVARDAAGNSTTSTAISITINNVTPDTTAPTVSITSPANNASVSGTIAFSANASDNTGVVGVQFKVDGSNSGFEDTSSPYSINLNTASLSNGSHSLTAVARDVAGNTTTSSVITVTVSNVTPDTTAPSVSITAPTNNATVSGPVTLSANAADNIGVVGVQFKVNGSNVGSEDTSSPYTVSWDSATVANGTYTLTAVVRDAAGNSTTSTVVTVNANNSTPVSQVAAPTFTPNGGSFTNTQSVTLSTITSGATIYYTVDGSTPTVSSTQYSTAFTLSSTATVKAIAVKSGMTNSAITSAVFSKTSSGGGSSGGGGSSKPKPTTLVEKDNFICTGNPTVYFYYKGLKEAYSELATYQAWNGSSFAGLKTLTVTECNAIPLKGLVRLPFGTFVKVANSPTVYRVENTTVLRPYASYPLLLRDAQGKTVYTITVSLLNTYTSGEIIK